MNLLAIALGFGAFLLGSVPFGVLVAKSKGIDILNTGSRSIGATNVYRTLGRGPGFFVLVLDVLKGLIPALLARIWFPDPIFPFGIGLCAVVGHSLSPWLKFRGGKGIATGVGALLGSIPLVALSGLAFFLICLLLTRYVSVGSIVAALFLAPLGYAFGLPIAMTITLALLGLFVVYRHKSNIIRLMNGTEPKFDWGGGNASSYDQNENGKSKSDLESQDAEATLDTKEEPEDRA